MSIESDAHLSYLVYWAFTMVARIVLAMTIGGALVAFIIAGASQNLATGILFGSAAQPFLLVATIWLSHPPRVTSDPELIPSTWGWTQDRPTDGRPHSDDGPEANES